MARLCHWNRFGLVDEIAVREYYCPPAPRCSAWRYGARATRRSWTSFSPTRARYDPTGALLAGAESKDRRPNPMSARLRAPGIVSSGSASRSCSRPADRVHPPAAARHRRTRRAPRRPSNRPRPPRPHARRRRPDSPGVHPRAHRAAALYGEAGARAVELYVEEVNAAGGCSVGRWRSCTGTARASRTRRYGRRGTSCSTRRWTSCSTTSTARNVSASRRSPKKRGRSSSVAAASTTSPGSAGHRYAFRIPNNTTRTQGQAAAKYAADRLGSFQTVYTVANDYTAGRSIVEFFRAKVEGVSSRRAVRRRGLAEVRRDRLLPLYHDDPEPEGRRDDVLLRLGGALLQPGRAAQSAKADHPPQRLLGRRGRNGHPQTGVYSRRCDHGWVPLVCAQLGREQAVRGHLPGEDQPAAARLLLLPEHDATVPDCRRPQGGYDRHRTSGRRAGGDGARHPRPGRHASARSTIKVRRPTGSARHAGIPTCGSA